jgi:hypothetical protein
MELVGKLEAYDKSVVEGATVINESETLMAVAVARRLHKNWETRNANTPPQRTIIIGDVAVFTVTKDANGNLMQGEEIMTTQTWSVNQVKRAKGEVNMIETLVTGPFDRTDTRGSAVQERDRYSVNLTKYLGAGIKSLVTEAINKSGANLKDTPSAQMRQTQYADLAKIAIQLAKNDDSATPDNEGPSPMAQAIANGNLGIADIMGGAT